ncbi:hypothetical protein [Dactylosporangium matsuzakiense]|uniref:Uncharacterized protein n=1 Tax=Dactylosporangium matsuzakiense TaxID=53360 RepID=A0A9W6KIM0_9ACTN|nr:hypothetical protein [Dactylosporangium matsuzakiense]UWZ48263.1 hypothetical protein Dmats_18755 [Dactylosporangium matsuzakiense]GLL01500.1 hypothetical protein GCM10017581_032410 [Dactylosporangium matsuzakiense]
MPAAVVELSGASPIRSAAHPRSQLRLAVRPREATENDEHQRAEWGDDWEPPYSWRAVAPADRSLLGMMSYPRRPAAAWEGFERNLRETLATLPVDLAVLDPYAWDVTWIISQAGGDEFVQGYFARLDSGRVATFETRAAAEADHGLRVPHPTAQDGLHVAELALTEIRSWGLPGPAGLRCEAWTDGGYRLDEFGLGLTSGRA